MAPTQPPAQPSAQTITLYTNPWSRGRIARWMLEEVGVPYRVEVVDYGATMKAPAYLAINPMGKVPALTHGDTIVTEGAAICAYLADAFPAANLAPAPGDPARGDYLRWMFFAAGPLEYAVSNRAAGFVARPEQSRMLGYGDFATVMDTLDALLSRRRYVLGDAFSAADVYLGSHIGWGLQFNTIEKRPAFEQYWARASDRPAWRKANELDDALVPPQPPKS